MKIRVTIEGTDDSDLTFIRDRIDAAVAEVIEENAERFDGEVVHETEYLD